MVVHVQTPHAERFLRRLRTGLFLAGALALGFCAVVYVYSGLFQAYESWRFDQALSSAMPELAAVPPASVAGPRTAPPRPVIRRKPREGSSLGRLEVPRLKVSVMVVEGITARDLSVGAGHIPGTALPDQAGNVGIAGHRDTFFRELRHIQETDLITFTTRNGVFRYAVDSLSVVQPSATEVLRASSGSELTLVTCFPFSYVGTAPRRFIVRAQRVE